MRYVFLFIFPLLVAIGVTHSLGIFDGTGLLLMVSMAVLIVTMIAACETGKRKVLFYLYFFMFFFCAATSIIIIVEAVLTGWASFKLFLGFVVALCAVSAFQMSQTEKLKAQSR